MLDRPLKGALMVLNRGYLVFGGLESGSLGLMLAILHYP